jgi:hypothetical protein
LVSIFALKDSVDNGSRRANNLAETRPISRIKKMEIPRGELDILVTSSVFLCELCHSPGFRFSPSSIRESGV